MANISFGFLSKASKLESVCFVDFQLSRYGPPVLDLLYNIFGGTDAHFRKQNYEKLLDTYYASLSRTIRLLGSDPDKLYTFENLKSQLRKYSEFALVFGPMLHQLRVAQGCNVTNLDDFAERIERGEDVDLIIDFDGETKSTYATLVNDLVTDLFNYGYIQQ